MAVYVAYALVVMHVALSDLQDDRTPVTIGMLTVGFESVAALQSNSYGNRYVAKIADDR